VSGAADPEEIQREIEQTRAELGDTVEALAAKADVKAQAKNKIDETKASVSEKLDETKASVTEKIDETMASVTEKIEETKASAEHLFAKAKEVSPDSAATAASQASQKARENPVPTTAIAAFGAGFLLGRLSKR